MAVVAKRKADRGAPLPGRLGYEIDPDHSRSGFAARYMGVATFRREFRSIAGCVEVDPHQPSKAEWRTAVDTISLDTCVVDRDNRLLSAEDTVALEHDIALLRRRGHEPADRHSSSGR